MSDGEAGLWTCPACGNRFVTANMAHSCCSVPLEVHFQGRQPLVRELFDAYLALAEACGPVTVIPQKSRISFQVLVRFAGAVTRKDCLHVWMWLKRRREHPTLIRVEEFPRSDFVHTFRLTCREDLDQDLAALMREAYGVGCREHLRSPGAR